MSGVAIFMFTEVCVLLRVPVCRHLRSALAALRTPTAQGPRLNKSRSSRGSASNLYVVQAHTYTIVLPLF